jgi:NADH:ubiquinone oxidoreductase subunit F (NADH-binding)
VNKTVSQKMKIQAQPMLTALLLLCCVSHFAQGKEDGGNLGKPREVMVGGHVARPGPMEYKAKTTLFAVIFAAGGETQFGTLKRVTVYRGGKQLQFDLTDKKVKNNEFAEPGDTIVVPQKNMSGK